MKNGVSFYETGIVPVQVSFPDGVICCEWCRCCIKDSSNSWRRICFATGEMIVNTAATGYFCPLVLEKKESKADENHTAAE